MKRGFINVLRKNSINVRLFITQTQKGFGLLTEKENIGSLNIKLKPITCGGDMITSKRLQVC